MQIRLACVPPVLPVRHHAERRSTWQLSGWRASPCPAPLRCAAMAALPCAAACLQAQTRPTGCLHTAINSDLHMLVDMALRCWLRCPAPCCAALRCRLPAGSEASDRVPADSRTLCVLITCLSVTTASDRLPAHNRMPHVLITSVSVTCCFTAGMACQSLVQKACDCMLPVTGCMAATCTAINQRPLTTNGRPCRAVCVLMHACL